MSADNVFIVAMTPHPLDVLYFAAKTCKSSTDLNFLQSHCKAVSVKEKAEFLAELWRKGHTGIFEHVTVTYAVEGISRACLAQLTRHRIGISFSVYSQRDGNALLGKEPFVAPPTISEDTSYTFYSALTHTVLAYDKLVAMGVPPEDARYILPMATKTHLVMTVNLRELGHLYKERTLNPAAQWEIKNLVRALVDELALQVPELKPLIAVMKIP